MDCSSNELGMITSALLSIYILTPLNKPLFLEQKDFRKDEFGDPEDATIEIRNLFFPPIHRTDRRLRKCDKFLCGNFVIF